MKLRNADIDDLDKIIKLYKAVAERSGGIARTSDEITEEYVRDFLTKSVNDGVVIIVEHPEDETQIIGEIHAYRKGIKIFNHVLSDLTIAVHPDFQSKKVGRTLFTIFLEEVALHHSEIGRVELITKESNIKAIRFYQSLGFTIEGRMEMRVKNADGNYEADIPMGWQNPNFEF
jgi:ribosomal protein S18 acetylase RimI-like enzyme